MTDLRDAKDKGFIKRLPCYNSIFNIFDREEVTSLLRDLIVKTSLPLKAVEQDFAVDSSGFSTSRFVRWFDEKYGMVRQEHTWVKTHLMVGVKTNVVVAVEIKDRFAHDTKLLPALVDTAAQNFQLREVSGDKAYGSRENYKAIYKHGATPFIAFRSNATSEAGGLWEKMFGFFTYRKDEFLKHYHKRSNVESTFSMIKAKFRDHVRSKTDTAMVNEVLCKILCHNICVLISAMFELGIDPNFGDTPTNAQQSA